MVFFTNPSICKLSSFVYKFHDPDLVAFFLSICLVDTERIGPYPMNPIFSQLLQGFGKIDPDLSRYIVDDNSGCEVWIAPAVR